ncbi:MAG: hypothetical protein KDB79_04895 [Acidobacteria bacterium]|nr:hypothetical protein [Acidobacteriota bacterium]
MSSRVLKTNDDNGVSEERNGPPVSPQDSENGGGEEGQRSNSDELGRLRSLIVESAGVAEVLPDAVNQTATKDGRLAQATLPIVEENIRQSVARDPKVLAEALFPAIGPAIRKAIAQALSSMVQSFNQTLEYSISPKGLGWRLEAFRTGKSFGEVVMLKTLLYRVEQVFLIHKETGLLIQHIAANPTDIQDADMVSAMLTAIQDFVQDSFKTTEGATLDSLKVKELSVWIEHSSDAVIAAVIRGTPPLSLNETFVEAIEEIQFRFDAELSDFEGRPEVFEETRPILQKCLQFQLEERSSGKGRFTPTNIAAGLLCALVLVLGIYFGWEYWRWNRFVGKLKQQPGIVVAESDFGIFRHSISGLRDPLAIDPAKVQTESNYDENDIEGNWKLYNDADPYFVLQRAGKLLDPPEGIRLSLKNGVLSAEGSGPQEWFAGAAKLAPALVGVNEFRIVEDEAARSKKKIESQSVLFVCNTADFAGTQNEVLATVAGDLEKLLATGKNPLVQINGHASRSGDSEFNENISKLRAEKIRSALLLKSEKLRQVAQERAGFLEPVPQGTADFDRDCKVTFKVGLN